MTINKVNSSNFPEKDINKSHKSGRTEASGSDHASKSGAADISFSDKFSLSEAKFGDDVEFARNELHKLNTSFDSLREIKTKIEEGTYDQQEIHAKVGNLVGRDLDAIEHILSSAPEPEVEKAQSLSDDHKRYLIENPEVIQKVADEVADELKNL